jgi:glutamate--cysteine ligase
MSLDLNVDTEAVTSVDDLVAYFREAERPADEHRVGLEHEKLLYPREGFRAVPYEGERGVGALLERLAARGYAPFREAEGLPVIALMRGPLTVSLEPGGQIELSGTPFRSAREAHAENMRHLADLREAAGELRLYPVALGYRPFDRLDQMPWMPKTRYRVMRETLPRRGSMATNMMLMTATGQVSLDWADEADCVKKTVVAARLAPLLVALYANSPIVDGRPTGFQSFRSHVWTDVDPDRCGFIPAMFDNSFSYHAYVQWALDVPLLFLRRRGEYLKPELTFRQLLERGYEGEPATRGDWNDHLTALFPEVRLKKVLEIRSADCVGPELTGALVALWRGILYQRDAIFEAARLLPPVSYSDHLELMEAARRDGLRAKWNGISIGGAAREMVTIAARGLERLDRADAPLLQPLAELAASGRSHAERVLEAFEQEPDPARFLSRYAA